MGGGKSDSSGVTEAMYSAQAAQQEYQLGEQQLQWSQQQWGQEYPYIQQIAQGQIQNMKTASDINRTQAGLYEQQGVPLQQAFDKMATQWASPQNIAVQSGQAAANVAESINAQKTSASQQLMGYGVNPGSPKYASLPAAMGVQAGAAEAGAATQAAQQTKMQGMQLMGQGVNSSQQLSNQVASLTGASSGAGAAGTSGISGYLGTGSQMMTAPTAWYNSGANNMGVYTSAVNGYNQAQATEAAGWGSALGSIVGMAGMGYMMHADKGGPIGFDDGGTVDSQGFGGGFSQGFNADMHAASTARMAQMHTAAKGAPPTAIPSAVAAPVVTGATAMQGGGPPIPSRYFQAGPAGQQGVPQQGIPPQNGTPGGVITPQMSPSRGQVPDDVDAKLTAGEFVMPLDVVRWKGKEYFYRQIDSARKQEMIANSRGDIGGEPTSALPSRNPQFVSRPNAMPQAMPARAV